MGFVLLALLAAAPSSFTPGLRVSWQAEVKAGSGGIRIDRAGDLWVVQTQGGEAVSLSATTGARRARLVGDSGPIDRYSQTARVLHGALIGPDKLQLAAVDVSTGKVRWKRTVGGLDPVLDEYSLRDWLTMVEAGSVDVIAFRHAAPRGDSSSVGPQWQFTLAGINPTSGEELWRRAARVADGASPSWDATVALFTDGERVLALAPGWLEALDAKTGAPVWGYALKSSSRPVLAWAPGQIALYEQGAEATRILDTATGHELATVPQPGGTVEALGWLSTSLCAVSRRDVRGEAACVAVEDGKIRELWRRPFELGPTQVLWDARRLFVTIGGERLLALDGQSGKQLWEVTLPHEVWFSIARNPRGDGQLFMFESGRLLALEREEKPAARLPPYLRFALAEEPDGTCQTKAIEWVGSDGKVLWSRPPPAALLSGYLCDTAEIQLYRQAPRYRELLGYWKQEAAGAVWIFTGAGLQGIALKNGELLFDATLGSANPLTQPSFFVDKGSFTYGNCRGEAPRGRVFAVCGQELLVFNGQTALVVDLPTRRERARGQFSQSHHRSGGRAAQVSAKIPVGERTLDLAGIIYMR
jgi:outer membrane protein assembly factor BamB